MNLILFCLGAVVVFIIWGVSSWIKRNRFELAWPSWLGIFLTTFLALFAVVWFISCILERETQAAGLGLLIFGGLAFISFGLTRKKIIKGTKSTTKINNPKPKS